MTPISQKSPIAFHQGETLMLIAAQYPTLLEVILEGVQNAIDEGATRVRITLNQRSRHLTVSDNGNGRTRKEFEEALTSVCQSIKPTGKLGRFGIGLISPLGKCERFTFTSTPKADQRDYREWTFVTGELRVQRVIDGIPMQQRHDLCFSPDLKLQPRRGETVVPWRTQVRIERFSKDRVISHVSIDELAEKIRTRFGVAMRQHGTVVQVRITGTEGRKELCRDIMSEPYSGKKLAEVMIPDRHAGDTIFRLYLALKTEKGRRGKVSVGEVNDNYRLSFADFSRSVVEWLDDRVVKAFLSGVFEGEILTSRSKLHAGRKRFVENEALVGFSAAINEWYEKHGQEHFQEAQEERRLERYQELGRRSLKVIQGLLAKPAFVALRELVDSFQIGSIGRHHTPVEDDAVIGPAEMPSVALTGAPVKPGDDGGGDRGDREGKPRGDLPDYMPVAAAGPRGRRRTRVKLHSLGLTLAHVEMEGAKLYELDLKTGTLLLNITHPLWVRCDEGGDSVLMRFQEYVAVQALTVHTLPEDYAKVAEQAYEELLESYTFLLSEGEALAGRKPGRPAKARARR